MVLSRKKDEAIPVIVFELDDSLFAANRFRSDCDLILQSDSGRRLSGFSIFDDGISESVDPDAPM